MKEENKTDPKGEGNRAAGRRYREGVKQSMKEGSLEKKAEEARRAVEAEDKASDKPS